MYGRIEFDLNQSFALQIWFKKIWLISNVLLELIELGCGSKFSVAKCLTALGMGECWNMRILPLDLTAPSLIYPNG